MFSLVLRAKGGSTVAHGLSVGSVSLFSWLVLRDRYVSIPWKAGRAWIFTSKTLYFDSLQYCSACGICS